MKNRNTAKSKKMNLYHVSKWLWAIFRTVLIIGLGFMIIQPVIMQLSSSFKSISDLYDGSVYLIPKNPTLYNYRRVWEYLEYPLRFVNSLLYCGGCSLLQLASCTLVAYGLARFKFKGRGIVMGMVIFTLIIPPQTVLLSLYLQFQYFSPLSIFTLGMSLKGINLIGTPWPLLILSATAVGFKNGLYIFMLRQHFKNLPKALEEAASIDGCGAFQTFFRVVLPGALPMMASILLFSFVWQWNDYFYTTILTPGMKIFTTVLSGTGSSIARMDGQVIGNMQNMLYDSAAFVLFIIPLIVLYLFTQKGFVQSIERSGLVG
ncbi:MAG: carbohydrate ABC transporter permease [Clostridiales bacterium]|nr:carbohydrate ABC transporter permease [Clostridiales bacterium]